MTFQQQGARGFSGNGRVSEINLTYTIGFLDPERKHLSIDPPSQKELEKIKNSLYDAELVLQFSDGETKRYDLLGYKEK